MKRSRIQYRADQDYYTLLGVEATASMESIQQAYRQRAKQLHPDMNPEQREWATAQFQLLNEAYEVLSDPVQREDYNNLRWIRSPGLGNHNWREQRDTKSQHRKYQAPHPPVYVVRERPGKWLEPMGLSVIRPFYAATVELIRSPYRYVLVLLAVVLIANLFFIFASLASVDQGTPTHTPVPTPTIHIISESK